MIANLCHIRIWNGVKFADSHANISGTCRLAKIEMESPSLWSVDQLTIHCCIVPIHFMDGVIHQFGFD